MILIVVALLAWVLILTHDQQVIRQEIDELWDVQRDITELVHEDAEKLRIMAEKLAGMKEENKS